MAVRAERPKRLFTVDEYWLIDAGHESVDVFRTPEVEAYTSVTTFGRGTSLVPIAFPDLVIAVDELFA